MLFADEYYFLAITLIYLGRLRDLGVVAVDMLLTSISFAKYTIFTFAVYAINIYCKYSFLENNVRVVLYRRFLFEGGL